MSWMCDLKFVLNFFDFIFYYLRCKFRFLIFRRKKFLINFLKFIFNWYNLYIIDREI